MNIYKILTFDGYSSREFTIEGVDLVSAIQINGMNASYIIKTELTGSTNKQE